MKIQLNLFLILLINSIFTYGQSVNSKVITMSELGMSFTMPTSFVTEKIEGDSYNWVCDYPSGSFNIEVSAKKRPDGYLSSWGFSDELWGNSFATEMIKNGYNATFIKTYEIPQASSVVGRISTTDGIKDNTVYHFNRGEYSIYITITCSDKNKLTEESWSVVSAFLKSFSFSFIKIGLQTWMSEDLDVENFRNGDLIPEAKTEKEWEIAKKKEQPAWRYYDVNSSNKGVKLYNWYAVNDPRGLAPIGWHIPSYVEWGQLITTLGGERAGVKLKSRIGWAGFSGDVNYGTNESNFYAKPFNNNGKYGGWWTSSECNKPSQAFSMNLNFNLPNVSAYQDVKWTYLKVRYVKD